MSAFDRYVGIPYVDKGRLITGCDCWGLLWLVYREQRGIDVPSYSEDYVTGADRKALSRLIADELEPWREVDAGSERPFDAVLMREGRFVRHIGVVMEPGRLLHVSSGAASLIERYREGALKHRVVGFYRYRDHE